MFKSASTYAAEDVIEVAVGNEKQRVRIKGQVFGAIPMAYDWVCYVRLLHPVPTTWSDELIVDSGEVRIESVCEEFGPGHQLGDMRDTFSFDAIAGHEYQVKQKIFKRCIELYDRTAREFVPSSRCDVDD